MDGFSQYWSQGDAVGHGVAILLLIMSIGAWVVIFWKGWLLRRARTDLQSGMAAFWRASSLDAARQSLVEVDRDTLMLPLVDAAQAAPVAGSLESGSDPEALLTRRLRDSLHGVLGRLTAGQVLLASVGSVSPFVGL